MHPWDAKLLPVVSLLLAAGYRPAGPYHNVPVRHSWGGPIEILARYDPIADNDGLDLGGKNK